MEHERNNEANPWKLATFALGGIIAILLVAGLVINYDKFNSGTYESPGGAPAYDAPPIPRGAVPPAQGRGYVPPAPRAEPPPPPAAAPAPRPPMNARG